MPSREKSNQYVGLGRREGSALGQGNLLGRLDLMYELQALEGGQLLDVGCGNGAYSLRMAEQVDLVVGIDIEPDRLDDFRDAAAGTSTKVLQASATAMPFRSQSFDAVTAIETMEHLGPHMDGTLTEIRRVLRPGGAFYLTTPNRWWPMEQHGFALRGRRHPGWHFPFLTWFPPLHRRLSPDDAFTPARLDRLVTHHGFRRTGLAYMLPPLDGHPGLRRRTRLVRRLIERSPLRRFGQTLVMVYTAA